MMWFLCGLLLGLLVMSTVLVIRVRVQKTVRHQLLHSMQAVSSGKYDTRMYAEPNHRSQWAVCQQFNEMAEHVEHAFDDMAQERDVLRHVMQNMTTGVVYLKSDGHVQMANQTAERLFRRPSEQWQERDHWTVFHNYSLGTAIDHALLFGAEWTDELLIREGLTVNIRLVPIAINSRTNNRSEHVHDVLMLVNDVSEWRRLERMRSEFVANVSHELKTPIAAIRGFAETLLDGDVDEAARTQFLGTIYEESLRMGNLVSDLLELSKLEATDSHVEPVSVDLAGVVAKALERIQRVAHDKGIAVVLEDVTDVKVWADSDMLLQVFLNLLTNAIHYSPAGGKITVTWDVLVDRVKVHVRDTGIGIPKESLNRVFERFYRVQKDRSRASGGTGLGLAIVKHIVTALGGEVGVESGEGEGSDFWFTLSRLDIHLPHKWHS
ncbi:two-component system histidine kinase PnpS [Alicyclobacillus fodiniaquatilis]|jgi:two-component system phosphate regulon sensor histidine kinase PhoR|uniref:histidine kinase n=1 Tax=Alicyclobacillus fodiniaquatilis TaxID=1661150 RepID=A0ABW4JGM9_9BACL